MSTLFPPLRFRHYKPLLHSSTCTAKPRYDQSCNTAHHVTLLASYTIAPLLHYSHRIQPHHVARLIVASRLGCIARRKMLIAEMSAHRWPWYLRACVRACMCACVWLCEGAKSAVLQGSNIGIKRTEDALRVPITAGRICAMLQHVLPCCAMLPHDTARRRTGGRKARTNFEPPRRSRSLCRRPMHGQSGGVGL